MDGASIEGKWGKGTREGKGKKGLRLTHFGWSYWETDGDLTYLKTLYSVCVWGGGSGYDIWFKSRLYY